MRYLTAATVQLQRFLFSALLYPQLFFAMDLFSLIALLVLGLGAGFIAGLLGVGGGLVLVPFMAYFMGVWGFPPEYLTHMAIATALSTITFTSLASMRSHYQHGAINGRLVWRLVPGMILGSWLGPLMSTYLNSRLMAFLFGLFAIFSATQTLLNKKPTSARQVPSTGALLAVTSAIGIVSSIVGAGGGAMTVPFLVWCNVAMRTAIATSSTMGFPIALSGSISYIYHGWNVTGLPAGSLGYIYVPAVVVIVISSMLAAHFGAKAAHHLPVPILKRIFAMILYALASYMLWRAVR